MDVNNSDSTPCPVSLTLRPLKENRPVSTDGVDCDAEESSNLDAMIEGSTRASFDSYNE